MTPRLRPFKRAPAVMPALALVLSGCSHANTNAGTRPVHVVYAFAGAADGSRPCGGLILSPWGEILGTTDSGFAGNTFYGGTAYGLRPVRDGYRKTKLFAFVAHGGGPDGPCSAPVPANGRNLLVTSYSGGKFTGGMALLLRPAGEQYVVTRSYSFGDTSFRDAAQPQGAPLVVGDLVYLSTTSRGKRGGGGVVSVRRTDLGEHVVHNFDAYPGSVDGYWGQPQLSLGPSGDIYGATLHGGRHAGGTVFSVAPAARGGTERVLYNFTARNPTQGAGVNGGLVVDRDGTIYGTATTGGTGDFGVVFALRRQHGAYRETILHEFAAGDDGSHPAFGLAQDGAYLYGTTAYGGSNAVCGDERFGGCGTIFRIEKNGSHYEIVHRFSGNDGAQPDFLGRLGTASGFFGTTQNGGSKNAGTVYRFSPP